MTYMSWPVYLVSFSEVHILTTVIRKHSSLDHKYTVKVSFHSLRLDPRVYALGRGKRSNSRTPVKSVIAFFFTFF